jgi:hypothetical protein
MYLKKFMIFPFGGQTSELSEQQMLDKTVTSRSTVDFSRFLTPHLRAEWQNEAKTNIYHQVGFAICHSD